MPARALRALPILTLLLATGFCPVPGDAPAAAAAPEVAGAVTLADSPPEEELTIELGPATQALRGTVLASGSEDGTVVLGLGVGPSRTVRLPAGTAAPAPGTRIQVSGTPSLDEVFQADQVTLLR